ncbi:recombinase family protein, partial [Yersinia pestis]|nr:recombinase family protein [Yersinia pestis]
GVTRQSVMRVRRATTLTIDGSPA